MAENQPLNEKIGDFQSLLNDLMQDRSNMSEDEIETLDRVQRKIEKLQALNGAANGANQSDHSAQFSAQGDGWETSENEDEKRWWDRNEEYRTVQGKVEEIEAWGHPEAKTLKVLVDRIERAVAAFDWAAANTELDQLLFNIDAIYDEIIKGSADKIRFEAVYSTAKDRIAKLWKTDFGTAEIGELLTNAEQELTGIRKKGDEIKFAEAFDLLDKLERALDAIDNQIGKLRGQKAKYDVEKAKLIATIANLEKDEDGRWGPDGPKAKFAQEALRSVKSDMQEMDALAEMFDYPAAMKMLTGIKSDMQNILQHEEDAEEQFWEAQNVLKEQAKLIKSAESWKFKNRPKEVDAFLSKITSFKEMIKAREFKNLAKASVELRSAAEAFGKVLEYAYQYDWYRVHYNLIVGDAEDFTDYRYADIAKHQEAVAQAAKEFRAAYRKGNLTELSRTERIIRETSKKYELHYLAQESYRLVVEKDAPAMEVAVKDALRSDRGQTPEMAETKAEITKLHDDFKQFVLIGDYPNAMRNIARIMLKVEEFYQENTELTRSDENFEDTNIIISKAIEGALLDFKTDLIMVAEEFEDNAASRVSKSRKSSRDSFISGVVSVAAGFLGKLKMHPMLEGALFASGAIVDFIQKKLDDEDKITEHIRQTAIGIRQIARRYDNSFKGENCGVYLSRKNPKLWNQIADLVLISDSDGAKTQHAVRELMFQAGLPNPNEDLPKQILVKTTRAFYKWEMRLRNKMVDPIQLEKDIAELEETWAGESSKQIE